MAVEESETSVRAPRTAVQSAEKRKAEIARRFAAQFTEEEPKVSPRWEKAIETYNRVKSETVTR